MFLHIQAFELLQFLYADQLVEFVTGTYFHRFHREMLAFLYSLHGFQIDACLVQSDEFGTRCGTRNQQLVAYAHFGCFYQELCRYGT